MTNFSSEILMLVDKRLLSSENQKKCDETLEKLIKSIKNSKENKERNGAGTKLKNNKDNPEPQANIQSK